MQQVEVFSGQLDQWRPLLRKQVDGLVVGLKMTDALENVYRAESHAQLLQSHANSLHSLLSACNVSQNGSRLVQLDSDITERVDSAQRVASIAHVSALLAVNMVSVLRLKAQLCVCVSGETWMFLQTRHLSSG